MLLKLLEEHLSSEELHISLNLIIKNVTTYATKSKYTDILNSRINDRELSEQIFLYLKSHRLLDAKIVYECDDDNHETPFIDAKCIYCGKTIIDHEYDELFLPNFRKKLTDYNNSLLKKYFDSESKFVMEDIRKNIHRVIPFIGSGISKSLGLPLWLEMFKDGREKVPEGLRGGFDHYYFTGDIDDIIKYIIDTAPMINDKKDLKMNLIKPIITAKHIRENELRQSILPKILNKDWEYIITTNYDRLLEQTNTLIDGKFKKSMNLQTFEGFEILEGISYIFHIHGDTDYMDSMIVDKEDYRNTYKSDSNMKVLSGLVNRHSLLFLGFSLNDKYFSEEFGKICESNKNYCTNYYVMINGNERTKSDVLKTTNVKFVNIITDNNKGCEKLDVSKQYSFLLEYIAGNIEL